MLQQRLHLWIALFSFLLLLLAVVLIGRLFRGDGQLLRKVSVSAERITPNADGQEDATRLSYTLTRNAHVSIFLQAEDGTRYTFREKGQRGVGDYAVLFSGVVEGYLRPDDRYEGEILARLVPNGRYQLLVEAVDAAGQREETTLPLVVAEASTELPDLRGFSVVPTSFSADWSPDQPVSFSPNRDGIADRLTIHFDLAKDVTDLRVALLTSEGVEYPAFEVPNSTPKNKAGAHAYDYGAGVDQGATPPPDGIYQLVGYAEDAEGQKVRVSRPVEITFGGVPRAEILSPVSADTLQLSATTLSLCDTLYFTVTVRNYGDTPIRTTGPTPNTVYDSDQNYNTIGWPTESGAHRLAIGYENELKDYPYRWAIGSAEQLTRIGDYLYLMPDQQIVVTGGIRLVAPLGERNPQPLWVGLIHEDVEIAQFNNRRDPHAVMIDLPAEGQKVACQP